MKAAASSNKPTLLKQTDIVSFYHIQMPRWLFADNRYNRISLAAKVAYSLLLNRHQLSKLNGWVNEDGEVYIIFSREELAGELQVGSNKAISVFKELVDAGLVWEKRRGNNLPNHIYLTRVVLSDDDAANYESAPFIAVQGEESGGLEITCQDDDPINDITDNAQDIVCNDSNGQSKNKPPEVRKRSVRTFENQMPGVAESKGLDMGKRDPSYIYSSYNEKNHTDISQSVSPMRENAYLRSQSYRQTTDDEIAELDEILENCDLWTFGRETAKVFENAIERLYFAESYKISGSVLPQRKVRSHLHELDQIKLQTAEQKILRNTEKEIRNTTAYTMAVIFNAIWETESDVMNDPYLNNLRNLPLNANFENRRGPRCL